MMIVAGRVDDEAVKEILLRDAVDRHELVGAVERALGGLPPALVPAVGLRSIVLDGLRAEDYWPTFVVNHLVLDGLSAVTAFDCSVGPVAELRGPATRSALLCQRGAKRAERWLWELSTNPNRPDVVDQIRDLAARLIDAYAAVTSSLRTLCGEVDLVFDTPPAVRALLSA